MIRFSSSAAGDVTMLDEHANQLLDAMGKSRGPRGVITAAEIPAVLAALRSAIGKDKAAHPAPRDDTDDPVERERAAQYVDLGRRAFPLIDLLERSARKKADVTWGV